MPWVLTTVVQETGSEGSYNVDFAAMPARGMGEKIEFFFVVLYIYTANIHPLSACFLDRDRVTPRFWGLVGGSDGTKHTLVGGGGRGRQLVSRAAPGVVVRFARGMMERERFGPD